MRHMLDDVLHAAVRSPCDGAGPGRLFRQPDFEGGPEALEQGFDEIRQGVAVLIRQVEGGILFEYGRDAVGRQFDQGVDIRGRGHARALPHALHQRLDKVGHPVAVVIGQVGWVVQLAQQPAQLGLDAQAASDTQQGAQIEILAAGQLRQRQGAGQAVADRELEGPETPVLLLGPHAQGQRPTRARPQHELKLARVPVNVAVDALALTRHGDDADLLGLAGAVHDAADALSQAADAEGGVDQVLDVEDVDAVDLVEVGLEGWLGRAEGLGYTGLDVEDVGGAVQVDIAQEPGVGGEGRPCREGQNGATVENACFSNHMRLLLSMTAAMGRSCHEEGTGLRLVT